MEIYLDELTKDEAPDELESKFNIIKSIASGSFGTVIQAVEKSTNREVAVKVINKSGARPSLISKMKEEISILKQLKHENIVQFFGYIETNSKLYIIMEFIKSGTLSHWIKTHIEHITEEQAAIIIGRLLSAVEYLHLKQICHRDIKPENIMLNNYNDLTSLKLIDFGLSAQHFDSFENSDYCGTLLYMAPEQIEKKLYSKTVDIWSIGVIMFMLLNQGKHPFYIKGDKRKGYIQKLKNTKITLFNKCSPMAEVLLRKLLEPNPSWRYTADKAIKHPWITRKVNDEVPLTMNDVLSKRNYKKCGKEIVMLSLFLNYYKKKEVLKNKSTLNGVDNVLLKGSAKKKNKIYKITSAYINRVNTYSKEKKDKISKIKERSLEIIISSDEDNSMIFSKPRKRPSDASVISSKSSKTDLMSKHHSKKSNNNLITTKILNAPPQKPKNSIPPKKQPLILKTDKFISQMNTHRYMNDSNSMKQSVVLQPKQKNSDFNKLRVSRNIGIMQTSMNLKNSSSGKIKKTESNKLTIPHHGKNENILTTSVNNNNIIFKFSPIKLMEEPFPNVKTISPKKRYTNNTIHKKVASEMESDNFSIVPLILPNINVRERKMKCKVGNF